MTSREEPLLRIAARRVVRRARREAATPEFARLLAFQASGAAGDSVLALSLAGSLFFSVPEATARGRVALYLLLTVAPLAVAAPLLARFLDRHRGGLRTAMVVAALGRGALAWWLSSRLDSLYLFPLAFGVLVLSRAALVIKGALLPELAPEGRPLVRANASLTKATALAGVCAVAAGLAVVQLAGEGAALLVAAVFYAAGAPCALGLPAPRGGRGPTERSAARALARSLDVRQASVAAAGMRLLAGFVVLHLAFALRRERVGALDLGLLVAAAAAGALAGSLVSSALRRSLREEGILVVSLLGAAFGGILRGGSVSVAAAAALVGVFGLCSGAAKVCFDAIVQRTVPAAGRGWAFARFESILQLAWVAGALIPLVLPVPPAAGTVGAGVASGLLGLVYLAGRMRARRVP